MQHMSEMATARQPWICIHDLGSQPRARVLDYGTIRLDAYRTRPIRGKGRAHLPLGDVTLS
jgi:hypothetical protein